MFSSIMQVNSVSVKRAHRSENNSKRTCDACVIYTTNTTNNSAKMTQVHFFRTDFLSLISNIVFLNGTKAY